MKDTITTEYLLIGLRSNRRFAQKQARFWLKKGYQAEASYWRGQYNAYCSAINLINTERGLSWLYLD